MLGPLIAYHESDNSLSCLGCVTDWQQETRGLFLLAVYSGRWQIVKSGRLFMGEMGDRSRAVFAEAYNAVGLDFTLEEQARITVIAQELRTVLESAKKRQQEKLRSAS